MKNKPGHFPQVVQDGVAGRAVAVAEVGPFASSFDDITPQTAQTMALAAAAAATSALVQRHMDPADDGSPSSAKKQRLSTGLSGVGFDRRLCVAAEPHAQFPPALGTQPFVPELFRAELREGPASRFGIAPR